LPTWTAGSPIGCNLTPCCIDRGSWKISNDFNAALSSQGSLKSVESSHTLPNSVLKQIGARPRSSTQPQVWHDNRADVAACLWAALKIGQ
jgi:hypothetical protein